MLHPIVSAAVQFTPDPIGPNNFSELTRLKADAGGRRRLALYIGDWSMPTPRPALMIPRHSASAVSLALVFAMAGATAQAAPSSQRGLMIAQHNCASCHATGSTGSSRNHDAPPFRRLSQNYPFEMLTEALREGMLKDHPQMPQFRFSPSEIDDLIAYLKNVQDRAQAQASPPAPPVVRVARPS